MILDAIAEAQTGGCRLSPACNHIGLDTRTVQRWRTNREGEDRRRGPLKAPSNSLSQLERQALLKLVNSPKHRDLSPKQIVPQLADSGRYLASESTIYRLLRREKLNTHRGRQKPRETRNVQEHVATAPGQVWSWDITYLKAPVKGSFFYLYLVLDVWSRKIVGARVHTEESGQLASELVRTSVAAEQVNPSGLVLHQDNGGPMKGATLKATLEALGIAASYSRPRVSNDNPFSESAFRTLKYRPGYPRKPFESQQQATEWVAAFVEWYNNVHLHSAIGFVTPSERHRRQHEVTLKKRRAVYQAARRRHPERWSGEARSWTAPATVFLNPSKETKLKQDLAAHAA